MKLPANEGGREFAPREISVSPLFDCDTEQPLKFHCSHAAATPELNSSSESGRTNTNSRA